MTSPADTASMAARLLATYDRAAARDLAAGLDWYSTACATADALAAGSGLSRDACAGIIAALSPRVTWAANVRDAARIVADPNARTSALGANVRKARRIALGESPLDVLGGPKVRAFYRNITGDLDAVTVDVWAALAATGDVNANLSAAEYAAIAEAYRLAASARGIAPRDLQAAVWVYVRRTAPRLRGKPIATRGWYAQEDFGL